MQENTAEQYRKFLAGGGEMGSLIRAKDWSQTPVGNPEGWPKSLLATLHLMLNSRFPMFLFWETELTCFYNDAFRPSLGTEGKHPAALGQRGEDCWAEIWPTVKPLIDQVMSGNGSVYLEDQLIPIHRNGRLEDVYWTFTYSPVLGDAAEIAGTLVVCHETTEKILAGQLEGSEKRSRMLFEQAPMAICIVKGPDFVVDFANGHMAQIWGRQLPEPLGKPLFEVLPEVAGQGFEEPLRNVLKTGMPFHARESIANIIRNGVNEQVYLNFVFQPLREDNSITGVIIVAHEITTQIKDRKNAQVSEARLRDLVTEVTVATCIFVGPEMIVQQANEPMLKIWGKDASIIGKTLRKALPELDDQPFHQLLENVYTTGDTYSGQEARADLVVDGQLQTFYFNFTYKALRDADGEIYGILNMATDVTAQVMARRKLEESEQRLNMALTSARMGTWDYDPATGVTVYSARTQELFGFRPGDEITPELAAAAIAEPDRDRVLAALGQVLQPGSDGIYDIEYDTINRHDGRQRSIRVKGTVFFGDNDQPVRFIGTASDITEEAAARREIGRKNEELNKIVQEFTFVTDFMPQIVWSTKQNGFHDFFNRQWYDYTGLTYEQTKDTGWAQVVHPDDYDRTWQIWGHSLATGEPYEIEYRLRRADGQYGWFLGRALPMRNDQGEITKWFGTCTDVSEQKAQTETLERRVAERTRTLEEVNHSLKRSNSDLEQFAYVASHDLQEPLRKITTVGSRLEKKYAEMLGDDGKMLLGIMTSAAERMKLLIESLLTFSRMTRRVESHEPVDLNRVMENIVSDYELKIMETHAVIRYEALPVIAGVPQQIHQLFQNLVSNAIKFTKAGVPPQIIIRSQPVDAQQRPGLRPDPARIYHQITFEDNGIGFEDEYAEKIFTIFQRLHSIAEYQGAGIGLSICRQVVENHGGTIKAEGRLGTGAIFTILLPGQQVPAK